MGRRRKIGSELAVRFEQEEGLGRCLISRGPAEARRLARLCEDGLLLRPVDGLYVRASFWATLDPAAKSRAIIRALAEKNADWVFSHVSAASIYGLSVTYSFLAKIHVISRSGSKRSDVIQKHRIARAARCVGGVRLTTPEETVLDCAALMPFPDALAVADSAVASRLTCEKHLRNAAVHRSGYRGIRAGRRVVSCVDGRSESGGESIVRGILIELGYRINGIQVPVASIDEAKGPLRLDLVLASSDGTLIDLEVDGFDKYVNPQMNGRSPLKALMRERQREAGITSRGYKVMRVTVAQARDREWLKQRLAAYGVFPELP